MIIPLKTDLKMDDECKTKGLLEEPPSEPGFEVYCKKAIEGNETGNQCTSWRKKNKCEITKIFKDEGLLDSKEVIIVAPGSTNVKSDWDVSIFISKEFMISPGLTTFLDFFNRADNNNYFKKYDNNYYLEPYLYKTLPVEGYWMKKFNIVDSTYKFCVPKIPVEYEIEALQYKLERADIEISGFTRPQIGDMSIHIAEHSEWAEKRESSGESSLDMQKKLLVDTYNKLDNKQWEEFSKNIIASRFYKEEAYYSQSAFLCVVLAMQLKLGDDAFGKIAWLVSALENAIDLYIHLKNEKCDGFTSSTGATDICYINILKYSKYIQRIYKGLEKGDVDIDSDLNELINAVVNMRGKEVTPQISTSIVNMLKGIAMAQKIGVTEPLSVIIEQHILNIYTKLKEAQMAGGKENLLGTRGRRMARSRRKSKKRKSRRGKSRGGRSRRKTRRKSRRKTRKKSRRKNN